MTEETPTGVELPSNGLEAAEAEKNDHSVTVLGKPFRLTKKLTISATYGISKAQKEEDLAGLIDATAKLIHPEDRNAFLEHILSDQEDGEEIDMEDFSNIFKDALEKVTGRPLEQ